MAAADDIVHPPGRGERTLIHHIWALLYGINFLSLGKMGLQRLRLDAGFSGLLRCAGCGYKALYPISGILCLSPHMQSWTGGCGLGPKQVSRWVVTEWHIVAISFHTAKLPDLTRWLMLLYRIA